MRSDNCCGEMLEIQIKYWCVFSGGGCTAFVAPPEGESMEDTWDSEGNEKSLMYIFAPEQV